MSRDIKYTISIADQCFNTSHCCVEHLYNREVMYNVVIILNTLYLIMRMKGNTFFIGTNLNIKC